MKRTCTRCGKDCDRDKMMCQKVSFHEMGKGGRLIRTRTVAWLCPSCVSQDPVWNSEPWTSAPGATAHVG